ncbi:kelch-like protein 38 [Branchiostoma lanceolatum]|uniref:kelch-like protein 38 n=1 Tax=Branchiostoma lanceolatum TaxID=7740 RepID=UPI003453E026
MFMCSFKARSSQCSDDACPRDCDSHCFKNQDHDDKHFTEFIEQRKNGKSLDVVVEVGGKKFPCHRAVLETSPFFKTMFSSNLAESNSKVIALRGMNSNTFLTILDFMYTGHINISKDDVQDILPAAQMLLVHKITEYCEQFIQSNLCPSNCVDAIHLANVYGLSYLKEKAREEVASNFSELRQTDEFLSLSTEELASILKEDGLQITNEEEVVSSVLRWLGHDPESRRAGMSDILREVRLPYVRVGELTELESHPIIRESADCLATIAAAKETQLSAIHQSGTHTKRDIPTPRLGATDDLPVLIGGWKVSAQQSGHENSTLPLQSIICLDPVSRQYYHITDLPVPSLGYMGVTSAGRYLYVTGGRVHPLIGQGPHSAPSRQAFRYDFLTDTWTKLPDMLRGRAGHQSVVVDLKLFLAGGDVESTSAHAASDQGTSLFSMDCYDLKEGVWIKPPPRPVLNRPNSPDITITASGGKVVLFELTKGTEECPIVGRPLGQGQDEKLIRERKTLRILINALNLTTRRWRTSEMFANDSLKSKDFCLATVDDGKVYFGFLEGHHSDRNFHVFEVRNGHVGRFRTNFKGNFQSTGCCSREDYADGQGYVINVLFNYKIECTPERGFLSQRDETPLSFALFGHSFLVAKKISIGWYCRVFKAEDILPKASRKAWGAPIVTCPAV